MKSFIRKLYPYIFSLFIISGIFIVVPIKVSADPYPWPSIAWGSESRPHIGCRFATCPCKETAAPGVNSCANVMCVPGCGGHWFKWEKSGTSSWSQTIVAPTCTSGGVSRTYYRCEWGEHCVGHPLACNGWIGVSSNQSYADSSTPALGHDWMWICSGPNLEADGSYRTHSVGSDYQICTRCGVIQNVNTPHNYIETISNGGGTHTLNCSRNPNHYTYQYTIVGQIIFDKISFPVFGVLVKY